MNAYDIMRTWDVEAGIPPRSDEELDLCAPAGFPSGTYADWKARLEREDGGAILEGRVACGLEPHLMSSRTTEEREPGWNSLF
jgi:hypothetical protein